MEVLWAQRHLRQAEKLVLLLTSTVQLCVTASHRVLLQDVGGGEMVVQASDVRSGDLVVVGNLVQEVQVRHMTDETDVIELAFEGDQAVAADAGLVTKGQNATAMQEKASFMQEAKLEATVATASSSPPEREARKRVNVRSRHQRQRLKKWRSQVQRDTDSDEYA